MLAVVHLQCCQWIIFQLHKTEIDVKRETDCSLKLRMNKEAGTAHGSSSDSTMAKHFTATEKDVDHHAEKPNSLVNSSCFSLCFENL